MAGIGDRLFNLEARIEGIFPLALGDAEGLPEWFEDFCEDATGAARMVFARFDKLAHFLDEDIDPEPYEVADIIIRTQSIDGFVCKISWCPRQYLKGGAFQSGWGLTRWRWVYGATASEAVDAALDLVQSEHEKAKPAAA